MSYIGFLKSDGEFNLIFNASEKIAQLKDKSKLFNFKGFKKVAPFLFSFDALG